MYSGQEGNTSSPIKHQPNKTVKYIQKIRRQKLTTYLSVFDHFVELALEGLKISNLIGKNY